MESDRHCILPLSIVDGISSVGLDDVVLANDERAPAEETMVDTAEASASLEPLPLSIFDGFSSEGLNDVVLAEEASACAAKACVSLESLPLSIPLASYVANKGTV